MTRQNAVPAENNVPTISALIPLWDLCNHTNGTISTDYNLELDRIECLADRNFKAGEQLFIFYGERTNADFFIHNGFVYDDNVHDSYGLNLGISNSDSLKEKRITLLQKMGIDQVCTFKLRNHSQAIDGDLIAFLRCFNMNEEQLNYWLNSNKADDLKSTDCELDTSLEKKVWKFLETRMKLLLSSYKTTLEDDLKILKNQKMSTNMCLAIRMRMTEKKILLRVKDYVEQLSRQ